MKPKHRLHISKLRVKFEGERYRRKLAEARIIDMSSQLAILSSKHEELKANSLQIIPSFGIPLDAEITQPVERTN